MSFSLQATNTQNYFWFQNLLLLLQVLQYKLNSYKRITAIIFFQKVLHFVEQVLDIPRGKGFHCDNVSNSFNKSI